MKVDKSYEKIQAFSKVIMDEVAEKKEQIINEANSEKQKVLEQKELEFLYDSYKEIQKAVRKIDLENNELTSRSIIESKRKLYEKRNNIINNIFLDVEKRINDFKKTPDYYTFIKDCIKNAIDVIGKNDLVISVNNEDRDNTNKIIKELDLQCEVEISEKDILGGCIAYSKESGLLINNSIIDRVKDQKQRFLENFNLSID